jgi:hypothetical protein
MAYFRVDKRDFEVNNTVLTAMEYYEKFQGPAKEVEDVLERYRPGNKPKRRSCLFVFENEVCAKKHWSKMNQGKLYSVHVDESQILHKGDMALMDEMRQALQNGQDLEPLATRYWAGGLSFRPEIEVLVPSAIVTAVLSKSEQERVEHLKARVILRG